MDNNVLTWEESMETPLPRFKIEYLWVCDCSTDKYRSANTPLRPTIINKEQCCIKCGYYAYHINKKEYESTLGNGKNFKKSV